MYHNVMSKKPLLEGLLEDEPAHPITIVRHSNPRPFVTVSMAGSQAAQAHSPPTTAPSPIIPCRRLYDLAKDENRATPVSSERPTSAEMGATSPSSPADGLRVFPRMPVYVAPSDKSTAWSLRRVPGRPRKQWPEVSSGRAGSRALASATTTRGAPSPRKGRGSSFSANDTLALAKAWVEHSGKEYSEGQMGLWSGIQHICARRYGVTRTSASLRCAWLRLARDSQMFLGARAEAQATGRANEDRVMEMYRIRTGRKDAHGVFKKAPSFRYVATALYLSRQGKYQIEYLGAAMAPRAAAVHDAMEAREAEAEETRSDAHDACREVSVVTEEVADVEDGECAAAARIEPDVVVDVVQRGDDGGQSEELDTTEDDEVPFEQVEQAARMHKRIPTCDEDNVDVDAKREREDEREDEREHSVKRAKLGRIGDALTQIASCMDRANELFADACEMARDAAYTAEDLQLLEVMDRDSEVYGDILADVMRARRRRVRCGDTPRSPRHK